ncbi:radical SAM protein [Nocardiopsis eucommiae]|uniref:Radical SAM protein n=1 Tax=Nocardiopsis eucommiae TaxID=2831970 RepID=A0A975L940_9ACTN|nr:radical SAM protein [Nocardiopsis eucommiae]
MPKRIVLDHSGDVTYLIDEKSTTKHFKGNVGTVVSRFMQSSESEKLNAETELPKAVQRLRELGLLEADVVFRKVERAPHLKRVQIETALRCNLECGYCYSTSGPGRNESLSREQVLSLIAEADSIGALTVDFTGGEFLLDPHWSEYVGIARSHGMTVTVHTNGTLIRRRQAELLSKLGVSATQVSVDSHIDEIHDSSRSRRGALQRTLKGIDCLVESNVPTRISIMAHKDNIRTVGATVDFMSERYPNARINIDRVVATGGALEQDSGLTSKEFWDIISPIFLPRFELAEFASPQESLTTSQTVAWHIHMYMSQRKARSPLARP